MKFPKPNWKKLHAFWHRNLYSVRGVVGGVVTYLAASGVDLNEIMSWKPKRIAAAVAIGWIVSWTRQPSPAAPADPEVKP
jgi:hypothetical protein